ncbi:hypothetical protein N9483_08030 [Flavobacteriaceae bacterium]|nr:hypothetical protein [Flavobacteriaceae bacterium]
MKKGLLSLLAVALTIVSCQNYDDQFAELTDLVQDLSAEVEGLSTVNASVEALSTTVNGIRASIAAIPTTDSTADLTALTSALETAQTEISAITALLNDVSSAADLAVVTAALADVQADVTTLLEADAVINQNITISNTANLEYASTLVAHSTDDPQVIVNGNVSIDTTSLTASETITANEIAGKLKTVIGNVAVTSAAALNLSNISFINGNYSVSGSDANDDSLVTVTGGLTTNYSGPNDYTQLSEVGAVVITNAVSATLVDFTGVTVASLNGGVMTFANATSVNLGTAPVTSLTANKATTIETRMVTSAGVTISGTSATAIDVNQMTSSTGAISVTGSSTTIVHFDALATIAGTLTTVTVGEAHFGALTQASGAISVAATTAANFASLTDTDAASSIGGATVFLTALATSTGTLTLPNATTANLPAYSTSAGNGVTATVATSANMLSAAVADLSLPKATSLTLTAQAENFTLVNASFAKLTTVDIAGKDVTGVTTTAISLTSAATLTTVTVGGEVSTLTVAGAGPTSLTTSGNITGLATTATKLATISLGHSFITGDTAVVIDIQNSVASAIDMSLVTKVKTITLTGNSKLASIVGPSSTVLPEAGAAIAVTLGTNSLTAVYTEGEAATAATETTPAVAAVEPTVTSASVSSILAWWSAAAGNAASGVATSTNIDIELVTVGTATPTTLATAYTNDAYNQSKGVAANAGTITTAAERSEVQ